MENIEYSRIAAAADALGAYADDKHRFLSDKRVMLTGEKAVLLTQNGHQCLLSSLRLLMRVCRDVTISLPAGLDGLDRECRALAQRIAFGGAHAKFGQEGVESFDAILSVGTATRPDLPWTVINSNGWVARVSSGATPLPAKVSQYNPIGALAAASLGAAEVFKRLIHLRHDRGDLLDGFSFSLFSYETGDDDPGPELGELVLDLLLVGAGAIGNGIIYLLSTLPISGSIRIVDSQDYGPENLGTCLMIGPEDVNEPKALFAEKLLQGRAAAKGYKEPLETFCKRLGELPYPKQVLCGLDNPAPRHQAQEIWPDIIIDGAIGDFPCQVSVRRHAEHSACMKCLFSIPAGRSADEIESEATGLHISRVRDPQSVITQEDVAAAPVEKQQWLQQRVGKIICSVTAEGVAQSISETKQRDGFQPSVPFVATMSAAMVVAEYVKYLMALPTKLETRYHFDMLVGPANGLMQPEDPQSNCECVVRAKNIDTCRTRRQ